MPIYMEISRLYRCVTIVARGAITPDEIMAAAEQLVEAQVPAFAKLVDVAGATTDVKPEQIRRLAAALRRVGKVKRGPVAFLIDRHRTDFARTFAVTQNDRPVRLFTSIREARSWLGRGGQDEQPTGSPAAADGTPWSDPERQATMIRGGQRRALPLPASRPAYATA
jgi:hypothetical protein